MANEILENAAEQIKLMTARIEEARELIAAMSNAGEDVSGLRNELAKAESRKNKWQTMLHNKGIM